VTLPLLDLSLWPELIIVEDAAQPQGSLQHGTRGGLEGNGAGTRLCPGKNIARSDACAITTEPLRSSPWRARQRCDIHAGHIPPSFLEMRNEHDKSTGGGTIVSDWNGSFLIEGAFL